MSLLQHDPPRSQSQRIYAYQRWMNLVDRFRYPLFALLAIAYLIGFNGQWRIEPDSALYLTLARNLAEGHGYTYLGQPHHLAYPGLPCLFAVMFKLFGSNVLWPEDMLMLALSALVLVLTYKLFKTHADRPTACVVTLGLAITHTFYLQTYLLLTDMPFLLGVMSFLYGYERLLHARVGSASADVPRAESQTLVATNASSWVPSDSNSSQLSSWFLLIFGLSIAIVMRPTMWVFLPVAAISLAYSMLTGQIKRGRIIALALIVIAAIAFFMADPRHSSHGGIGDYEDVIIDLFAKHFRQHLHEVLSINLPQLLGRTTALACFGIEFWKLSAIFSIPILLAGILLIRRRLMWGLWVFALAALMALVLPLPRYYLAIMPLLVYAWWLTIACLNRIIPGKLGDLAFLIILALGSVPNMLRMGQVMIEQHRQPFLQTYRFGNYADIDTLAKQITTNVPENSWVIAPLKTGRVLTFLSRRNVMEVRDPESRSASILPAEKNLFLVLSNDDEETTWLKDHQITPDDPIATIGKWHLSRARLPR